MSDKGWIKTYRKIQDCWIWQIDKPFDERSAWIDLLLIANHRDVKIPFNGDLVTVKRGQIITSVRKLSEKWKWNKDKTLKFLRLLESDNMITKSSDRFRTLITIENYSIYQDKEELEQTQQGTEEGTQDGHEPATNKNVKNDKNNILCSNSLNEQEIEEQKKNEIDKQQQRKELESNFEIIYKSYPKKVGKTKAFESYKAFVTTGKVVNGTKHKLTNRQIWSAITRYKRQLEQNETEKQFIKNFDTFMNKAILDYVGDDTE